MVEVACECDEGRGCPHTHWTKFDVRRDSDGQEFTVYGSFIQQPGVTLLAVEHGLRYWGDRVDVDTDDLELVLTKMPVVYAAVREAHDRLLDQVQQRRRTFPV